MRVVVCLRLQPFLTCPVMLTGCQSHQLNSSACRDRSAWTWAAVMATVPATRNYYSVNRSAVNRSTGGSVLSDYNKVMVMFRSWDEFGENETTHTEKEHCWWVGGWCLRWFGCGWLLLLFFLGRPLSKGRRV